MTKDQKNEVIEVLKGKFSQYSNFYITNTESLSVAQVTKLRGVCFDKQVEMKVAKNTLIRKALEGIDSTKYAGVIESLHQVTALMFSENPKEPALIISSFRKDSKGEKPVLKAAFINGDIYIGDNQLLALTKIKTKNELIGEVIGLLQSPAKRVLAALLNKDAATETSATEVPATEAPATEAPATEAPATEAPVAEAAVTEAPAAVEAPVAATETAAPAQETSAPAAEAVKPAAAADEIVPEAVPAAKAPSNDEEATPSA